MDQFYADIYEQIIYKWLMINKDMYEKHHIHFHVDSNNSYKFIYEYQDLQGIVQFYNQQHIIEEIILDKDEELLFYLHFHVLNLNTTRKFIIDFFQQLVSFQQPRHIGMSCSCGITSSVFIDKLQELSQLMKLPYQFDVVPLYEVEKVYQDYDMIILAPQTSFLEPKLKLICQDECLIKSIDPTVFATNNYNQALTMIQNVLE